LALRISASPSETKKEESEVEDKEEEVEEEEVETDGDSNNKKKKKADIDLHGWEVTCSRYELMASLAKLYGEEELPDPVPMPDGTSLTLPVSLKPSDSPTNKKFLP
jgi:hypothetical protein